MKNFCAYIWRSPVLLFVVTLGVVVGTGWFAVQSQLFSQSASLLFKGMMIGIAVLPICLMLFGLFDCLGSENSTNTKLLWVIIMLLAPVLGPLLWFLFRNRMHDQDPTGIR